MELKARIKDGSLQLLKDGMIIASAPVKDGQYVEASSEIIGAKRFRGFQLLAKNMAAKAVLHIEDVVYDRAGGDVVCPSCGLEYYDHPKGSMEFLTLLCNGTQVKL